jgi:hypothetical protein
MWNLVSMGIGVAVVWIAGHYQFFLKNCDKLKQINQDAISFFPKVVANSEITASASGDDYVHRFELEGLVNEAFNFAPMGVYFVVYGNKGVGKSELITRAAIGRKGVVKIGITSAHSKDEIVRELLESLHFLDTKLKASQLVEQMREVKEKHGIFPTIIFDVERASITGEDLGIQAVRSLSKALAETCRCIIILSEANAVLQFGKDRAREEFIFVDELSREEAKTLLKNKNFTISAQEMDYVFEKIGTDPATLLKLTRPRRLSLMQFVEAIVSSAEQDLVAFPLQTMLKALKDNPNGVSPRFFQKYKEAGIDLSNPCAVEAEMKWSLNPIVYRIESKTYQLLSTIHKTALKSYDPIRPISLPKPALFTDL